MDLAAFLELLYSARDRSRTVYATVHRRSHPARELELLRARGLYRDPPAIPKEEGAAGGPPPTIVETTTQLWAARPDRLRWETTARGYGPDELASVGVKAGEVFWERSSDGDLHTNENREQSSTMTTDSERLVDPSPLLGVYRFELGPPTTWQGRGAVEVTASRRSGSHPHWFGPLSDQLALVVDAERGVLLRTAVALEDEELSNTEIVQIVFDEPLQAKLFQPLR
jgi:outer membrane lipoprotein-sorting protein